LDEYEEGQRMPFVTGWGRDGMLAIIEDLLRDKFGDEGANLLPNIAEMDDAEKFKAVGRAIAKAATLDEVRRACAEAAGPAPRRRKGANGKRGRPRT
jgi:hypothetical protein